MYVGYYSPVKIDVSDCVKYCKKIFAKKRQESSKENYLYKNILQNPPAATSSQMEVKM